MAHSLDCGIFGSEALIGVKLGYHPVSLLSYVVALRVANHLGYLVFFGPPGFRNRTPAPAPFWSPGDPRDPWGDVGLMEADREIRLLHCEEPCCGAQIVKRSRPVKAIAQQN